MLLLCAAWLAMVSLIGGCTAAPESDSSSGNSATTAPSASSSASDPPAAVLGPVPASTWSVHDPRFLRAADGTTFVLLRSTQKQSWYRIYDAQWRPVSETMTLPAGLEPLAAFDHGFLVEASRQRRSARLEVPQWLAVDPGGSVSQVDPPAATGTPQRGDVLLRSVAGRLLLFRPATARLLAAPLDAGIHPRFLSWYVDQASACAVPSFKKDWLYWTASSAGTWKRMVLADVVGPEVPRNRAQCYIRNGRMVIQTASVHRRDPWSTLGRRRVLYTIDLAHPSRWTSYRLGGRFNPYGLSVLGDGRAVFTTKRRGLMVATTRQNTTFAFRAGPVRASDLLWVLGTDLVADDYAGGTVQVSTDAGRSWREVDLRAGTSPSR